MKISLRVLLATSALGLIGCSSAPPLKYNVESTRLSAATTISGSYNAIEVGDFYYSPPGNLGQFDISAFGCLPCRQDGGFSNMQYAQPIKDIVKAEVRNVLQDFQLAGVEKKCAIGGVVNVAGWSVNNGEQTLDITYSLSKNGQEIVKKRILQQNYEGLFSSPEFARLLEKVTQKSVENFLMSQPVSQAYKEQCTKT